MGRCSGISDVMVAKRYVNWNDDDEADDEAMNHDDGPRCGWSDDGHLSGLNGGVHCDGGLNAQSDAMNCDVIAIPNPILLDPIQ